MFRVFIFLSVLTLVACTNPSPSPNNGGQINQNTNVVFGCYCNQDGQNSEADIDAFQTSLGAPVLIHQHYSPFDETSMTAAKNDIAHGRIPMLAVSCVLSNGGYALYTDQLNHKYDSQIIAKAFAIKGVPGKVMLRLFFEPTNNHKECNPTINGTLFVQTWNYWRYIFARENVTNVLWTFNCGEKCWASGQVGAFYPQSAADIVSEDVYNDTLKPENFPGEICKVAAAWGKPIMISETGAIGATLQKQWFGSVKAVCPNLAYLVPFDSQPVPTANYIITDPTVFPVVKAMQLQ